VYIDSRWFECSRPPEGSQSTLFCFPHAGGNAFLYRTWQAQLPDVLVSALHLPGRGRRLAEPPFVRMEDMVEAAVRAMLPLMTRPFTLFGHSMGALLAFEVARVLEQRHRRFADHVFLAAAKAPELQGHRQQTHQLPDSEFIATLRALSGTPEELLNDPQVLAVMLPMLRGDFEVVETYRYTPGPPLTAPFTVFGGAADASATRAELEPWAGHTRATCAFHVLPGDHFFIREQTSEVIRLVDSTIRELMRQRASRGW
jgi:medium-chain acyl-[acyl-carrier-protein] hydrolase